MLAETRACLFGCIGNLKASESGFVSPLFYFYLLTQKAKNTMRTSLLKYAAPAAMGPRSLNMKKTIKVPQNKKIQQESKMRMNIFNKVIPMIALAAALLTAASCSKDDDPQPKYNIVELPFGALRANRATVEDVQNAFASGADSVYLVSQNNFTEYGSGTMETRAGFAKELVAVNPSKTKGRGEIVCESIERNDSITLARIGFKVRAGKVY
jgi:hypothetical protein